MSVYSGPVKAVTVSWDKPIDPCPDCDCDEREDDGGTYITVRVPSQDFGVGMRDEFTLTITRPDERGAQ